MTLTVYTPLHFRRWLAEASPGDTCIYWTGQLAIDAGLGGNDHIGDTARRCAINGLVFLTQRYVGVADRHGVRSRQYDYLATKASHNCRRLAMAYPLSEEEGATAQ